MQKESFEIHQEDNKSSVQDMHSIKLFEEAIVKTHTH